MPPVWRRDPLVAGESGPVPTGRVVDHRARVLSDIVGLAPSSGVARCSWNVGVLGVRVTRALAGKVKPVQRCCNVGALDRHELVDGRGKVGGGKRWG